MPQWTSGYFTSYGTKLHFYRSGGNKPPVVLVHGITDDGLCWSPVAEVLSGDYDVLMVDLRAHGKSDAPQDGYNLPTMATELSELITGLGLKDPVVLGHSLGAVVAMTLAGLTPDLPRAIILEDPPTFWRVASPSLEDANSRAGMLTWFVDLKRKTRDELLEIARLENPFWSEAELGPWADSKHRFSPKIARMIDSQDFVPANFPALLGQITCPVLLITADPERGAIVADNDVLELQKSLPHLEVIRISGAGHNIRRDQFIKYIDVTKQFLSGSSS
jgi:pimeloyl-ACP methyl ester carboxylesterase